ADRRRGRQWYLRHDPDAPGADVPRPRFGHQPHQSRLRGAGPRVRRVRRNRGDHGAVRARVRAGAGKRPSRNHPLPAGQPGHYAHRYAGSDSRSGAKEAGDDMNDERLMEGKVAVVTGAGNGIGRAIAVMMAAHGAKVVINDIGVSLTGEGGSASPAEETREAIVAAGGEAAISTDSVADPESAKKIVQCALDNFGRIDAVVNNAGILRDSI